MKKLSAGEQPTADDLANLSKDKRKSRSREIADMEKVRDVLKELAKTKS
jgi:hypothetical protein